jgi:arsenical pump membrane protein
MSAGASASLTLALVVLGLTLAAAVTRPARLPEWAVAAVGAVVLVGIGALDAADAWNAIEDLAPTVCILAALLVLGEMCRREGLFDAAGALLASSARGSPKRLLALVFAAAAAVTAALSLDATVVFLTPIVFATATRLRMSPKAHVYACSHLANSASLLLPVSNLTNLLAFHASGLSFSHFAALMTLPTAGAVAVEWIVFRGFFTVELGRSPRRGAAATPPGRPPPLVLTVLALTLAGFALSSVTDIAPVWAGVAGATAGSLPALARRTTTPAALASAAQPGFLVFVLALGVIVRAAADNGLGAAVDAVLPGGGSLPALLGTAALSAVLANLVNNLPAALLLVPVTATAGSGPVLATLIGVNVGPNLTYVGSLATLLWRRVLQAQDTDPELGEFLRLGALTVPAALLVCTVLLWFSLQVLR